VEKGRATINIDDESPSAFVVEGLELEETQYVVLSFCDQLLISHKLIMTYRQALLVGLKTLDKTTVGQQTSIQLQRTNLLKRIMKFSNIQNKYMPGLDGYIADLSPPPKEVSTSTPELIPLYLPSSLPKNKHPLICIAGVQEIEDRLRFAQASEALNKLQCQLMRHIYISRYKVRNNISSQHQYT
jgi:hypothetical protein